METPEDEAWMLQSDRLALSPMVQDDAGDLFGLLRAMRGQQAEQLVVAGGGGVEGQQRDELRQPPLVRALRREGAQRRAGVATRIRALRAPAVERRTDRRPAAAGEIRQALVREHVPLPLAAREAEAPQRAQELVREPVT